MARKKPVVEVSRGKVRALLAKEQWVRDERISSLTSSNAYVHADGRLLLVFHEGDEDRAAFAATLWQSKEWFLEELNKASSEDSRHILAERLPQGEKFPSKVNELIDELAAELNLPKASLDYSIGSIDLVDATVRKNYVAFERMSPPLFPRLMAYVGETILHAAGGRWEMRPASTAGIWEPWVVTRSGAEFAPFAIIFKELYDRSDANGNLAGGIEVLWK
jgi:hypothetical protein